MPKCEEDQFIIFDVSDEDIFDIEITQTRSTVDDDVLFEFMMYRIRQ